MILVAFSLCSYAQSIGRQYDMYSDLDVWADPSPIEFFRGDSLDITLQLYKNGYTYALPSSNIFVLWQLMKPQSGQSVYQIYPGTVLSSTGGIVKVSLMASETMIDAGEYDGYLTISIGQGFLAEEIRVAQHHAVNVRYGLP